MKTQIESNEKRITLFIAEDDPDDLDIFTDAIREVNSDVFIQSFSDGDSLMKHIYSDIDIPDLIFLDINMPYVTGMECLRKIREDIRFIRTPVIMFTTSGTREDIMESFYAGATRYITKPNEFKTLINFFEQLFNLHFQKRLTKTDLLNFAMKPHSFDIESDNYTRDKFRF